MSLMVRFVSSPSASGSDDSEDLSGDGVVADGSGDEAGGNEDNRLEDAMGDEGRRGMVWLERTGWKERGDLRPGRARNA